MGRRSQAPVARAPLMCSVRVEVGRVGREGRENNALPALTAKSTTTSSPHTAACNRASGGHDHKLHCLTYSIIIYTVKIHVFKYFINY